jgi:hypothetical protein
MPMGIGKLGHEVRPGLLERSVPGAGATSWTSDSGGPFFGFWNDGPYAVGTTRGGESITGTPFGWGDEDNNIEAGGSALVNLVLWAQANWP